MTSYPSPGGVGRGVLFPWPGGAGEGRGMTPPLLVRDGGGAPAPDGNRRGPEVLPPLIVRDEGAPVPFPGPGG